MSGINQCSLIAVEKKKRKQYPEHALQEAVAAVKQGMSVRQAALKFNVPRRTVGEHASGNIANYNKPGPKAELSKDEEEALVGYIKYMSSRCLPLRRNDLRATILVRFQIITTKTTFLCSQYIYPANYVREIMHYNDNSVIPFLSFVGDYQAVWH